MPKRGFGLLWNDSVPNGLELLRAAEFDAVRDMTQREPHQPLSERCRQAPTALRTDLSRSGRRAPRYGFPSTDGGKVVAPPFGRRVTAVLRLFPPALFVLVPGPPVPSDAVGVGKKEAGFVIEGWAVPPPRRFSGS